MTTIQFTVQGTAVGQGSKRHVGNGVMVESSKRLPAWRTDVRAAATQAMWGQTDQQSRSLSITPPIPGPVHVVLEFRYRRGSSHYRADGVTLTAAAERKPYPTRPDIDKLARGILDCLTGIVIRDDRQVVWLDARREWGARDETVVSVTPLAGVAE